MVQSIIHTVFKHFILDCGMRRITLREKPRFSISGSELASKKRSINFSSILFSVISIML